MSAALAELVESGRAWRGQQCARIAAEATGHSALDALLPGRGWPVGGLSEIVCTQRGAGELALVLPLLARLTQAGRDVALVAPPLIPHAPALAGAGVLLPRLFVAEAPEPDLFWSV
jgi:protein ImuA